MALQINHGPRMLKVAGQLTAQNTKSLKRHLKSFLTGVDHLLLNIEKVTYMDEGSAFSLEQMYLDAVRNNKVLVIIGMENNRIASVMKDTKTSYILSHDRV
ncbi:STAS domain-containing protein [Maribacter sp. 2304DJ31-5]|uniref:STAS domain-containing protein n=1 Tax=Maribacter sp. 2304DJ31-5 TaxID=3386273 RepID=UPI0039BD7F35